MKLIEFIENEDHLQIIRLQNGLAKILIAVDLSDSDKTIIQMRINGITIEKCNRLKTTAGNAHYRELHIKLHSAYFDKDDECYIRRWETVFHEIAHLVSYLVFGWKGRGHNKYWRFVFKQFGFVPKRCYDGNYWNFRGHKQRKETREVNEIANTIGNFNL